MAYDPVKAHEYYIKYRKKGLKKGRKKGSGSSSTTSTKSSLVGLGTAGLNDTGKMQWAMLKRDLQDEMNAKLKGITDADERKKIITEYQNRALQSLQKIKADPTLAAPKKASSGSGSGRSSGGGSSRRSSSSSSSGSSSKKKSEPIPYIGHKAQTVAGAGATKKGGNKTVKVKKAKEPTPEIETQQEKKANAKAQKIAKANKALVNILEKLAANPKLKDAKPEKKEYIHSLVEGIIAKLDKQNDGSIDMNSVLALKNKILL